MIEDDNERESLIEQVVSAWRPRNRDGGVRAHPAWHDLDATGRAEAAERTARARLLEAALDDDGLSSTGRAVLARIRSEG
ncbi:MAG: hypothetical protein AAF721_19090 [Myxococcota bacterium]